jgi:hypothetical protein
MFKTTVSKSKQEEETTDTNGTMKYVKAIYVSGQNSATIILPKRLVREHGLESGSHVVIETRDHGILIRKIRMEEL